MPRLTEQEFLELASKKYAGFYDYSNTKFRIATEKENMVLAGYRRIYDCGNAVYELNLKL